MMNFRLATPEVLVDIGRLAELRVLRSGPDGALEIGAATRQSELLREPAVVRDCPLLAEGTRHIGHPQIRSRGTVCGSLAHHDPTAELPALAVALGARLTVAGPAGRREVDADGFFRSYYEVALDRGEILVSVSFPRLAPGTGWSFHELAQRRGDFALVGAACVLNGSARLVLFGVGERPMRLTQLEDSFESLSDDELATAVRDGVEPLSDIHASADYRRSAVAELAVRCRAEARARRA
jgi:aerobic carbon-monoxide dehydrogenase medium subunit